MKRELRWKVFHKKYQLKRKYKWIFSTCFYQALLYVNFSVCVGRILISNFDPLLLRIFLEFWNIYISDDITIYHKILDYLILRIYILLRLQIWSFGGWFVNVFFFSWWNQSSFFSSNIYIDRIWWDLSRCDDISIENKQVFFQIKLLNI